ncbi:MAG TPA: PorV/PorQ family protein [Ignavibacteriaceae bacterium]|nr:PorV/PorQ family protein [Ignavibacteriaceae bacterium]
MRRLMTVVFLMIIFSTLSFAGDVARKGTTGADQLLVPVGARGIATAGAFVSNLTGLEAIYYNPAGLDVVPRSEGMFSYMSYLADINVSYFAVSTSLGNLGSVGLSFKTFDIGQIPVTTFDAPDGTGAMYSPSFLTGALTYSKVITDRVSIGINAKVISETIMATTATGFALDFGVQYRFAQNIAIGAAVKNIGTNMRYTGQDLQVKTGVPQAQPSTNPGTYEAVSEEFQIPSYFALSASYNYDLNKENNVLVGATFVNNNSFEDELKLGLEYGYAKTFFVRGGYNLLTKNTSESNYGLTFGAGLDYEFTDGLGVVFDYAFRDVKDFPKPNHIFTVKLVLQ